MEKTITLKGKTYPYKLTFKKVKNINLRIALDGKISLSCPHGTPLKTVEAFLISKGDFIIKALNKLQDHPLKKKEMRHSLDELKELIKTYAAEIYPHFKALGFAYPTICFKKLRSRWGYCQYRRQILTFNTELCHVEDRGIYYVVAHEFTHLIVQDHSRAFYAELSKICPEWKEDRKALI